MAHKFDSAHLEKLDAPERRQRLAPAATLDKLGFSAGQTLADLGCGTGVFSLEAAKAAGKVYAVDIGAQMLEVVKQRASTAGFNNVVTVLADEYDCKLPEASADFIIVCTVLHEIDDKVRWLKEAARICKAGGHIAVIEFVPAFIGMGPPASHRLKEEQTRAFLKEAGFSPVQRFLLHDAFYVIRATRM